MKKYLLFTLAIIIAAAVPFSSCQKDDPADPPTRTQLLTKAPWVFQSATASGSDISTLPLIACFKDNILTFSTPNGLTIAEGANVCSPSLAGNFTWTFATNETQLQLSAALLPIGSNNTFDVITLNETNLVLSQNVVIPPSTAPLPVAVTFKH
jgi:hypothetical protein